MALSFTPKIYQEKGIEFLTSQPRCALWADMGMGKTVSMLTALELLTCVRDVFPVLILAPYRVANKTWPEEQKKWNHLRNLNITPITGLDEKGRIDAFKNGGPLYSINYEHLPWLVELFGKKWPFKTVISDESTRLKPYRFRQGGKRTRALGNVSHYFVENFYELTGSPSPLGIQDLWGQLWFLDEGKRLGRTYDCFKKRWFAPNWNGYGVRALPGAQEEIQDLVKDICMSLLAEDYFDLKEPRHIKVPVELPSYARKHYNEMEREMYTEFSEDEKLNAKTAAAKSQKCLQMASGAAYTDPEDKSKWYVTHDEKIEALKSIIEELNGETLLVAYHFKSDLARLKKAFPQGKVFDKKPQTEDKWNRGEIPLMFAHPASAGHGSNLQHGGRNICFFTHDWNLENYEQIIERLGPVRQAQAGYNRIVNIFHIVAQNTVEEQVMERNETKASVQEVLKKAMRRRKEYA